VLLPPSRRTPIRWLEPAAIADALARIGQELGAQAQLSTIVISDRHVTFGAVDPRSPGAVAEIMLSGQGFTRSGSASIFYSMKPYFALSDIAELTAERIAALQEQTLQRLNMPRETLSNITISHNNMTRSPKGRVTVEVRVERPNGSGGWVVYELDGTVIATMRP
jgi:hypothetical protein